MFVIAKQQSNLVQEVYEYNVTHRVWNNFICCALALVNEYTYMYEQTTHLEVVCSVDSLRLLVLCRPSVLLVP